MFMGFMDVGGFSMEFHRLNPISWISWNFHGISWNFHGFSMEAPKVVHFLEVFNSMVAKISMSSKARFCLPRCHRRYNHMGMCKGNPKWYSNLI
jgi:hypothetical protein